ALEREPRAQSVLRGSLIRSQQAFPLAETTSVADQAVLPSPEQIARVERFTQERFVHEGEELADALAPGGARRRAFDSALQEIDEDATVPSTDLRRRFSLLLGLERLLSEEEPHLADGTLLNPHQVDALSGTLTALLAEAQRNGDTAPVPAAAPVLAVDDADEDDEGEEEDEDVDRDEEPLDDVDEDVIDEAPDDPNAHKRFWFEHATGDGDHRSRPVGAVTVETYQWFVRNAGRISSAYTIVICDEAHTALGEKTSAAIRAWTGPIFIGMTATGALIARHVTDLFPTQTSRFDLAQAARRGVIAPLRCIRIPPGPGVRTIAKVPLRRGEVDQDFDQEELAALLDQEPFNVAVADLYRSRFRKVPGVVYTAGVRHAYNVASAFRDEGMKAEAVSGETPKRELAEILARYERGDIDVLINAQLLA